MSTTLRTVQFGNTLIPFGVAVSPRRETIAITVKPDMTVRVVTPPEATPVIVDRAVRGKAEWIIEQWDNRRRMNSAAPRQFRSGESIKYLGRNHRLRIRRGSPASLRLFGGAFEATVPLNESAHATRERLAQLFQDWYREHGTAYLTPLVEHYGGQLGIDIPPLRIVSMKTRWGSCSARSIRFHWQVMMAPRRLVRYVVAHEVCHLKYPDHSRPFWRLLERVMPDCHQRHAELAVLGPRLSL